MSKSIEEMYQALIEQTSFGEEPESSFYDDDDCEDFLTSKEIVKTKNDLEERFGVDTSQNLGDSKIEEEAYFKRYTKRREHKYTEKELEEIRKSCKLTIVHDYGISDRYHQSDEERASNDMLSDLSIKLQGLKRTYRKVDQYVEAMRVVVQAWEMLESKGNFMHTKEEFFKMVSEGRIVSNQIIMPKLKGMDKYNIDLIIKYISNPELNASDLAPEPIKSDWDDWYLDDEEIENLEEKMTRLLSPEDFAFIEEFQDNPPDIEVSDMKRKYIKGYNQRNYGFSRKRHKNKKKCNKQEIYIRDGLHEILNKIQLSQKAKYGYSTASSLVTDDLFDTDKKHKTFWDDLYFDGSWSNDDDLFLYDLAIREEMLKQHVPGSGYVTYGDKELSTFFRILEDNGVNTIDLRRKMDCPTNGESKAEEAAKKKDNKKVEAALIQRITKLNQSDKFKKIVTKAEAALNKQLEDY